MLNRGTLYKLRILYPAFLVVFYLTGLFVGRVYYPATAVISVSRTGHIPNLEGKYGVFLSLLTLGILTLGLGSLIILFVQGFKHSYAILGLPPAYVVRGIIPHGIIELFSYFLVFLLFSIIYSFLNELRFLPSFR